MFASMSGNGVLYQPPAICIRMVSEASRVKLYLGSSCIEEEFVMQTGACVFAAL